MGWGQSCGWPDWWRTASSWPATLAWTGSSARRRCARLPGCGALRTQRGVTLHPKEPVRHTPAFFGFINKLLWFTFKQLLDNWKLSLNVFDSVFKVSKRRQLGVYVTPHQAPLYKVTGDASWPSASSRQFAGSYRLLAPPWTPSLHHPYFIGPLCFKLKPQSSQHQPAVAAESDGLVTKCRTCEAGGVTVSSVSVNATVSPESHSKHRKNKIRGRTPK